MYGYLSLLNYLGHFDTIQINYLIVGHTHGPIDQYFSVLSYKLYAQSFVGSPMALQCLFSECENPQIIRQIWVHRDWKSWLLPCLNTHLKLISLPHVILFTLELGISILQHKAFSSKPDFLPLKPHGIQVITDKDRLLESFESYPLRLEELGLFGGFDSLHKALIGTACTTESLIRDKEQNTNSTLLGRLMPDLHQLDCEAAAEAAAQMEHECEHGYPSAIIPNDDAAKGKAELDNATSLSMIDRDNAPLSVYERFTQSLEKIQAYADFLKNVGTKTTGYCIMLNYSAITESWLNSKPKVFNYIEKVSKHRFH